MASSKEYLDFVMDQLSSLNGISYKSMMGLLSRKDELSVRKHYVILIYLQFSSIMGLEKERGSEENEGRF